MNEPRALIEALCARLARAPTDRRAEAERTIASLFDMLWLVERGLVDLSLPEPAPLPPATDAPDDPPSQREPAPDKTDGRQRASPPPKAVEPPASPSPSSTPQQLPVAEIARRVEPTQGVSTSAPIDEPIRREDIDDDALLYVAVHAGTGKALPAKRATLVAGAPPLGRHLDLERAFGALRTHRATPRSGVQLDVERTIRYFAVTRRVRPQWKSKRGRWLDLVVVIERSPTMRFWQASAKSLVPIAARGIGALSTTTLFLERLRASDQSGALRLTDHSGRRLSLDARPRGRLVLYVSDTLGPGWMTGEIPDRLADWAVAAPVLVLHVLPHGFWARTSLAQVLPLDCWTPRAGNDVVAQPPPIPLLSYLGAASMREAIGALAGNRGARAIQLYNREAEPTGLPEIVADKFLTIEPEELERNVSAPPRTTEQDIDELWSEFESSASRPTKKLARYLAVAPLVMPVMRLIERALVPEAAPWQLAELVMSGLIRRWPGCIDDDPERMEYEFLPGIRERLLLQIAPDTQADVIDIVTKYVERRFGRAREFEAYCNGEQPDTAALSDDREFAPFVRAAVGLEGPQPPSVAVVKLADETGDTEERAAFVPNATFELRDETDTIDLKLVTFSIPSVVEYVAAKVADIVKREDLTIRVDIDPNVDGDVFADPRYLVAALVDVAGRVAGLANCHAMTIATTLERRTDRHYDVSLVVHDGWGEDSATARDWLLGRHRRKRRGEVVVSPPSRCKTLVDAMGGTVGVRSASGKNTSIWTRVQIPLAARSRIATESRTAIIEPAPENSHRSALMVGPADRTQARIRQILRSRDIFVESVDSLPRAFARLESTQYEYVFLDLYSSDSVGFEVALRLRGDVVADKVRHAVVGIVSDDGRSIGESFDSLGIDVTVGTSFEFPAALWAAINRRTDRASVGMLGGAARATGNRRSLLDNVLLINEGVGADDGLGEMLAAEKIRFKVASDRDENCWRRARKVDAVFLQCSEAGPELLAEVRRFRAWQSQPLRPNVPVFAILGRGALHRAHNCRVAGVDRCLSSPVSRLEMRRLLDKWEDDRNGAWAPKPKTVSRLLFIQPSPWAAVGTRVAFKAMGLAPNIVESVDAAERALRREHYDLIVIDVDELGGDVREVVDALRLEMEAHGETPFLGLSLDKASWEQENYTRMGLNHCVSPSAGVKTLLRVVKERLLAPALERAKASRYGSLINDAEPLSACALYVGKSDSERGIDLAVFRRAGMAVRSVASWDDAIRWMNWRSFSFVFVEHGFAVASDFRSRRPSLLTKKFSRKTKFVMLAEAASEIAGTIDRMFDAVVSTHADVDSLKSLYDASDSANEGFIRERFMVDCGLAERLFRDGVAKAEEFDFQKDYFLCETAVAISCLSDMDVQSPLHFDYGDRWAQFLKELSGRIGANGMRHFASCIQKSLHMADKDSIDFLLRQAEFELEILARQFNTLSRKNSGDP